MQTILLFVLLAFKAYATEFPSNDIAAVTNEYDTFTDNSDVNNEYTGIMALRYFIKYVPTFIMIGGVMGNILSFCVFSRKTFQNSLTAKMFRFLAVTDTAAIVVVSLPLLVNLFGGEAFSKHIPCKIQFFLTYIAGQFSVYVLMIISVERLVGVFAPHKARMIFSGKRMCIALIVILLFLVGVFGILAVSSGSISLDDRGDYICSPYAEVKYLSFMIHYMPWSCFIVGHIIPITFMIYVNIAIVFGLLQAAESRKQMSNNSDDGNVLGMVSLLLINTTAFVVLRLPNSIALWTVDLSTSRGFDIFNTTLILKEANFAINFILYCLAGKHFRKELMAMILRRKPVLNQTKTSSTSA